MEANARFASYCPTLCLKKLLQNTTSLRVKSVLSFAAQNLWCCHVESWAQLLCTLTQSTKKCIDWMMINGKGLSDTVSWTCIGVRVTTHGIARLETKQTEFFRIRPNVRVVMKVIGNDREPNPLSHLLFHQSQSHVMPRGRPDTGDTNRLLPW